MVRPLPHDRARARRDFRRDGRQGQDRELNVDESPKTASKYGVMSIPTLMIFKGGEMASRQVGAARSRSCQQWITAAV